MATAYPRVATRKEVEKIMADPRHHPNQWGIRQNPDKWIGLGTYGKSEIYSNSGVDLFRLDICYNPPKCTAYIYD